MAVEGTRSASRRSAGSSRLGPAIERREDRDFPFYDGLPFALRTWQWVVVIVGCAAGLAILYAYPAANDVQSLVPRILFVAVQLGVFICFTRGQWRLLLRPVHVHDVLAMLGFAVGNLIVTFGVGAAVSRFVAGSSNDAVKRLDDPVDVVAFYAGTAIQIFGEELLTILPFLAVMAFCTHARWSRRRAVVVAWFVTAAWFAAAHLPTYDWNFVQTFVIIGLARLILTLAYIRTKNLLVSTGAHVLNDWILFTSILLAAAAHA